MNSPARITLRSLAALLCALAIPALSQAQTSGTWTSTTGGNWSDTTNWSGSTVASGAGAVATFSASGTQTVNLDANETVGTLSPSVGSYTFSSSNGSVLTFATGNSTAPTITGTANITADLAGTQGFTFSTGGTRYLYLSGNNSGLTGNITLGNGSQLYVQSNYALGAGGSNNTVIISQASGAFPQLHFQNNVTVAQDITVNMSMTGNAGTTESATMIYNDSGNNTLTGNITFNRSSSSTSTLIDVFNIQAAGNLALNGNISGAATGSQASGAYADATRLQLTTTGAAAIVTINGVISDGTLTASTGTVNGGANGGLSIYTNSTSLGTVRLTGNNTYTGSTTVNGGTLALTGSGSISHSTIYNIASGAKFDVSGLTIPGYSLANVATTLGVGATTNGYINVGTGALTLGGTSTLTLNFTAVPTATTFSLYTAGSVSGDFTSVALTGTLGTGNLTLASGLWSGDIGSYNLSLNETTGILTVASAIPEPATTGLALAAASLGVIAFLRRRRKA